MSIYVLYPIRCSITGLHTDTTHVVYVVLRTYQHHSFIGLYVSPSSRIPCLLVYVNISHNGPRLLEPLLFLFLSLASMNAWLEIVLETYSWCVFVYLLIPREKKGNTDTSILFAWVGCKRLCSLFFLNVQYVIDTSMAKHPWIFLTTRTKNYRSFHWFRRSGRSAQVSDQFSLHACNNGHMLHTA